MTDNDDFAIIESYRPAEVTREEYRQTVKNLAEKIYIETQLEMHDSLDDGIEEALQHHIYLMDTHRAMQIISLSKNHPFSWDEGDSWQEAITQSARSAMSEDLRDEITENQGNWEEELAE